MLAVDSKATAVAEAVAGGVLGRRRSMPFVPCQTRLTWRLAQASQRLRELWWKQPAVTGDCSRFTVCPAPV
jgi:hypothetical protein